MEPIVLRTLSILLLIAVLTEAQTFAPAENIDAGSSRQEEASTQTVSSTSRDVAGTSARDEATTSGHQYEQAIDTTGNTRFVQMTEEMMSSMRYLENELTRKIFTPNTIMHWESTHQVLTALKTMLEGLEQPGSEKLERVTDILESSQVIQGQCDEQKLQNIKHLIDLVPRTSVAAYLRHFRHLHILQCIDRFTEQTLESYQQIEEPMRVQLSLLAEPFVNSDNLFDEYGVWSMTRQMMDQSLANNFELHQSRASYRYPTVNSVFNYFKENVREACKQFAARTETIDKFDILLKRRGLYDLSGLEMRRLLVLREFCTHITHDATAHFFRYLVANLTRGSMATLASQLQTQSTTTTPPSRRRRLGGCLNCMVSSETRE